MVRYSGLQKDVFKLYRELIRCAKSKDSSGALLSTVRTQFRVKAYDIQRNDFKLIEHSLRWGYKQKTMMEMPGFKGVAVV